MNKKLNSHPNYGLKVPLKRFIVIAFLVSSSLGWWLVVNQNFYSIFKDLGVGGFLADVALALFYGSGAISALIGSSVGQRMDNRRLLAIWTFFGIISTLSMLFFSGVIFSIFLSILLGFSIGFGFPTVMAFVGDSTVPERRGRVVGLVVLLTFIVTFAGMMVISPFLLSPYELLVIASFCTLLRSAGLISLLCDKCEKTPREATPWKSIISHSNFFLYLLPWVFFCTAAGLIETSVWSPQNSPDLATVRNIGLLIYFVLAAVSGLIAGAFADRIGRKQPIIIALVLIGVTYALFSFGQSIWTMLIYEILYGIAWGFLFTLYLTIPGDLSPLLAREKFYALSAIVPLAIFTGSSLAPTLFGLRNIPIGLVSPFMSLMIFLSIIPVLRARETLPESVIQDRKMNQHLKRISKIIEEGKEDH